MPDARTDGASFLIDRARRLPGPDRIIVTAGVTGSLSLLAQVLRADGHTTVALEDPSAAGNRRILTYWMGRTTPVPVDDDGLDVGALAASGAGAVLVTPAHQYPTGVVLAPERRRALARWASGDANLVIEDDHDAEYRYDRRPVRAVQPLAPEVVAYTASLSKTLAPALRLGWLVPPARPPACTTGSSSCAGRPTSARRRCPSCPRAAAAHRCPRASPPRHAIPPPSPA